MSPAPALFRDKTLGDVRDLRIETATLAAVLGVSTAAAAASFFALYWVGRDALGWPAPIAAVFPLAVDGMAAAASAATVGRREPYLRRLAWAVFLTLLALSLASNVAHAFHVGHPELLPTWLFVTLAAAPPVIVALGVHLYALIARNGVSNRIATTNPDQVIVDQAAFEAGTIARRSPTKARPTIAAPIADDHPRSPTIDSPGAPEPDARPVVEPREAAAFAAFQRAAATGRPSGGDVAQLLLDHGARDDLLTPAQGRKVRARWEAALDAMDTELHLADPARDIDDELADLQPDTQQVRAG